MQDFENIYISKNIFVDQQIFLHSQADLERDKFQRKVERERKEKALHERFIRET